MFVTVCKQTFHISHVGISQKVKDVLIWNLKHIILCEDEYSGKFSNLHSCTFNNAIPENHGDPEHVTESKYYDKDKLQQLKIPNKERSLLYINSRSLNKTFDPLQFS